MSTFKTAVSVRHLDLAHLEAVLKAVEAAGVQELHFDIMDGHFVPELGLNTDLIKAVKQYCALPCNAHLMVEKPGQQIARFIEAGCDVITVHVEADHHAHRLLGHIRTSGASPAIAINPATPLTTLEYLLPEADRVLVLAADPGQPKQKCQPNTFERVRILHENIRYREYRTQIEVAGPLTAADAARMLHFGAQWLVLGKPSLSGETGLPLDQAITGFLRDINIQAKQV